MTDKVIITGLRAEAVIGAYDWERDIQQPLVIDIELATDASKAAATDNLQDALDYAAVASRILEVTGTSSYQLIETLAERLAGVILDEFAVTRVWLKVTKPTAVAQADSVAVIIERRASELGQ